MLCKDAVKFAFVHLYGKGPTLSTVCQNVAPKLSSQNRLLARPLNLAVMSDLRSGV